MARDLIVRYLGDASNLQKSSAAAKSTLTSTGAAAERMQQRYAAAVQVASRAAKTAATAEAAAARKVGIEQLKVQEIRRSGKASASQLATADDRLATAQENLARAQGKGQSAAKQLASAQDAQVSALKRTGAETDKAAGIFGRFGGKVKSSLKNVGSGAFSGFSRAAKDEGSRSGRVFGTSFGGGIKAGIGAVAGSLLVLKGLDLGRDLIVSSVAEARESQKVGATSAAIIKSTGGAAKVSADQLGALTTAISNKTGVDDEAIQSGSNLLLTFKNVKNEAGDGAKIFDRATAASVDLSKAGFGSIEGASKQLGKALNDPVKGISALNKAGVTFTQSQKDQIKALVKSGDVLGAQKVILGEVESQVGGVAEASTTAGEKLKTAWDNSKEAIGTAFLPVLDKAETALRTKLLPVITDKLVPALPGIASGLGTAMKLIGSFGRIGAGALRPFLESLTGGKKSVGSFVDFFATHQADIVSFFVSAGHAAIGFGKGILGAAAVGIGGLRGLNLAAGLIVQTFSGMASDVLGTLSALAGPIDTVFGTHLGATLGGVQGKIDALKANALTNGAGIDKALGAAGDGIKDKLLPALDAADAGLDKVGNKEIGKAAQRDSAAKTAQAIRAIGTASNGSQVKLKRFSDISKLSASAQSGLRSRIKSAAGALKDQIGAQQAAGSGQKALTKTWETGRSRLTAEFRAMGLSRKEAGRLGEKYAGVKPKVKTKFETPGLPGAKSGTDRYKGTLKNVPGKKTTSFSTPGLAGAKSDAQSLSSTLRNIPKNIQIKINQSVATKGDRLAANRHAGGVWNGPDTVVRAATGRVLPGWSPGRDIHRFFSATAGELDLSGGEAVMVPQFTRAVGGPAGVDRLNKQARNGDLDRAMAGGGVPALVAVPDGPRSASSTAVLDRPSGGLSQAQVDQLAAAMRDAVAGLGVQVMADSRGMRSLISAQIADASRKRQS
jgi:hypothetical protein